MGFDPNKPYQAADVGGDFDPDKPYTAAPSAFADKMADQRNSTDEHPKWDVLGDMGRVAKSSAQAIPENLSKAFPSAQEQLAQDQTNKDKYGSVLGTLKGALVDPVSRMGDAAKVPLNALGVLTSPITGALHGTLGSALSYVPGIDNKKDADELIDKSMVGLGPRGMEGGFSGVEAAANAERAAVAAKTQAANASAVVKNPAFAQARAAGYVVHPAETEGAGAVPNALAQMGGKIKTEQAASVHNQKVTNGIAARELGLPPDAHLDEATFNSVRGKAANAYKVIENSAAKLPSGRIVADNQFLQDVSGLDAKSDEFARDFPEAAAKRSEAVKAVQDSILKQEFSPKAGIEMIRNLRDDARVNLKNWTDTDKTRTGMAQRDAADAIEGLIERNLQAAGDAKSVAEYRAARQTIAKTHDIESATDPKGNVDARKLSALGNKRPFTGGLKIIADTAGAFPKSMQDPTKFGGLEKRSVLDGFTALASGTGAMATHDWRVALPGLMAMVARPAARTAALSNSIQNRLLGLRSGNQLGSNVRQLAGPAVAAGANAGRAPNVGAPQQPINALRALSPPVQPPQAQP